MLDALKEEHPDTSSPTEDVIVECDENDFLTEQSLSVLFEAITRDVIRKCALQTEGSAGPSMLMHSCVDSAPPSTAPRRRCVTA